MPRHMVRYMVTVRRVSIETHRVEANDAQAAILEYEADRTSLQEDVTEQEEIVSVVPYRSWMKEDDGVLPLQPSQSTLSQR